ncbi:hypothetical protein [Candidatus Magnetobacterium casense]|uniref:hypothetical protein n=1 Tax=Candidatus Magnetobacterium casense TaxID=1455061 RepID=UPI0012DD6F68|nr:hypothetical protein [Candidatus Magnetobacterium casensis]
MEEDCQAFKENILPPTQNLCTPLKGNSLFSLDDLETKAGKSIGGIRNVQDWATLGQ